MKSTIFRGIYFSKHCERKFPQNRAQHWMVVDILPRWVHGGNQTFSQCYFLELSLDIAHCFIEADEKNDFWGPKDGLLKFTPHLLKDYRQMLIYLWNGLYFTKSDVVLKTSSCRNENCFFTVSIKLRIHARTDAKCWGIFSPSAWVTASASQCWRQYSEECLASAHIRKQYKALEMLPKPLFIASWSIVILAVLREYWF